jgi:hypothetical protein
MPCVEINLSEDGTFTVAECEPKEEAVPGEESGQAFASAEEAMQAAMQILTAGQVQDPGKAQGSALEEQDMMEGFSSVRGRGLNG